MSNTYLQYYDFVLILNLSVRVVCCDENKNFNYIGKSTRKKFNIFREGGRGKCQFNPQIILPFKFNQ